MKLLVLIGLIFLSYLEVISAQDFFPLHLDNRFQYEVYHISSGGSPYYTYPKIFVDTSIIVDQDTFYNFNGRYYRYDPQSLKLYQYFVNSDTTILSLDFSLPQDSSAVMNFDGEEAEFTSSGYYTQVIFGEVRTMYKITAEQIQYPPGGQIIDHWRFDFADGIGLVYSTRDHDEIIGYIEWWYNNYQTLQCAKVDSIKYNPYNIDIHILTDLQDREIKNFPFVLRVGLSISDLFYLDSLYAEAAVIRADSILITRNFYNISPSLFQASIDLDSTILAVGDLVKIRCVATDNTIFYTSSSDPDSGYYEFTVLPAEPSGVSEHISNYQFRLYENYPNPFNPTTKIRYQIPELSKVMLKVYNVLGKEVTTLENGEKPAGNYEVEFNGSGLPSGIYFYRIEAGKYSDTKKFILMK